ncbi:MAG: ATP synthase F1 subunit epsilon [Bacteroidaceae bacterium]|nr:ATP synthase F1 subunit epsilon [Bacteroidaceae bacterium]
MSQLLKLDIVSPEKQLFSGEVEGATFPGDKGRFTVLYNHAPIISTLGQGTIRWVQQGQEVTLDIKGGFVEVKNNRITVCVEID